MKFHLEVFARIKPSIKRDSTQYYVDESRQVLSYEIPRNMKYGHINNLKSTIEFSFSKVFDQDSQQEDIFENVAKPLALNCLEGYNGTLFCYGQTGSGKTFTMSGAETWKMRGVIPRTLQFLFEEFQRRKEFEFKCHVSFMEIYNENAYDLLNRRHLETRIEDWQKINVYEEDSCTLRIQNLSQHRCESEREGLDLMMLGNFVRQVSSTQVNDSSSRSHCIFTISIEGRKEGSDKYFLSKLHLVDLAGSERIQKTNSEGSVLTEAKHINLSLAYLEQVIVALYEKSQGYRQHIPYRNSLMTTVLKDSLGGNCKTVMIATISPDIENLEESISTARFAQRSAQIENEVKKNEKIDPDVYIKQLEKENYELKQELEKYKRKCGDISEANSYIQIQADFSPISKIVSEDDSSIGQFQAFEINTSVEAFLNGKLGEIDFRTISEARTYFHAIKDSYNIRMKEFIDELTSISKKLRKYECLIAVDKNIETNPRSKELLESREGKIASINQLPELQSIQTNETSEKSKRSLRSSEITRTEPEVVLKENKKLSQELHYKVSVYRSPGRTRAATTQSNVILQKSPKSSALQKADVPSYTYSLTQLIQGAQMPVKKKEIHSQRPSQIQQYQYVSRSNESRANGQAFLK